MALKKFDIPDIDEAISAAKDEEQRKRELETADRIADAIGAFIEKSPAVVKAMKEIALSLAPDRFTAKVDAQLKKSADETAELFKRKVSPMVERLDKADRQVSIPVLTFGIIIISLVFLTAFLFLMIYANASTFHSDSLSWTIALVILAWAVCVAIVTYLSRKL